MAQVIFLKATTTKTITVPAYTKRDGTIIPAHTALVHYDPNKEVHEVVSGQGSHSQKVAHKKLMQKPGFSKLPVDEQFAHILSHATKIQKEASNSAALSLWASALGAGKMPTNAQQLVFDDLPLDKKMEQIEKAKSKGADMATLNKLAASAIINSAARGVSVFDVPEGVYKFTQNVLLGMAPPQTQKDAIAAFVMKHGDTGAKIINTLEKHVGGSAKLLAILGQNKAKADPATIPGVEGWHASIAAGKVPTVEQHQAVTDAGFNANYDKLTETTPAEKLHDAWSLASQSADQWLAASSPNTDYPLGSKSNPVKLKDFPGSSYHLNDGIWISTDNFSSKEKVAADGLQAGLFLVTGQHVPEELVAKLTDAQKAAIVKDAAEETGRSPMDIQALLMGAADIKPAGPAWELDTFKHTTKGHDVFVVPIPYHMLDEEYAATAKIAKKHGGHYSKFASGGAKKGFLFPTTAAGYDFINEVSKGVTFVTQDNGPKEGDTLTMPAGEFKPQQEYSDASGIKYKKNANSGNWAFKKPGNLTWMPVMNKVWEDALNSGKTPHGDNLVNGGPIPKDGDTKIEGGKTYVLYGGRWHLQGSPELDVSFWNEPAAKLLAEHHADPAVLGMTDVEFALEWNKHNPGKQAEMMAAMHPAAKPEPDISPEAVEAYKTGSFYQKKAYEILSADGVWDSFSNKAKLEALESSYKKMQGAASHAAAVSLWKKSALSGKNPTTAQWKAYMTLDESKQKELFLQVEKLYGDTGFLKPLMQDKPALVKPTPQVAPQVTPQVNPKAAPVPTEHLGMSYSEGTIFSDGVAKQFKYSPQNDEWLYREKLDGVMSAWGPVLNSDWHDTLSTGKTPEGNTLLVETRAPKPEQTKVAVKQQTYQNTMPGHNKFWSVYVAGNKMTTTYGKIGTKGSSTTKEFHSNAGAKVAAEKLIKEKKSKDYEYAGSQTINVMVEGPAAHVEKPAPAPLAGEPKWDYDPSDMGMSGAATLMAQGDNGMTHYVAFSAGEGYEVGSFDAEGNPIMDNSIQTELPQTAFYALNKLGVKMTPAEFKKLNGDEVYPIPVADVTGVPMPSMLGVNLATKNAAKKMLQNMKQHVADGGSTASFMTQKSKNVVIFTDPKSGSTLELDIQNKTSASSAGFVMQKFVNDLEFAALSGGVPKEGDTKQGADGQLVFKDGRWHKVEKTLTPAQKKAAVLKAIDAVKIPDFLAIDPGASTTVNYVEMAKKLKALVKEKGLTGFESALTPIANGYNTNKAILGFGYNPKSTSTGKPRQVAFVKFCNELKAATGGVVSEGTPSPAAHFSQPAPSAAAKPIKMPGIKVGQITAPDIKNWEQTGPQKGSNPGGQFKDKNGQQWYCKFPTDPNVVKNEFLAAKFYQMLGVAVPNLKLVSKGGKLGIASKWVDGLSTVDAAKLAKAKGAHDAFAIDAWLANWDVVGLSNDNLMMGKDGAVHVDVGGSLLYRAQGGAKGEAFGDTVTELESLLDAKLNPKTAAVYGKIKEADMQFGLQQLNKLKPSQIEELCEKVGPGTVKEQKALAKTLIARRAYILQKYGIRDQWNEKPVNEAKLSVNASDLPKPIDFVNYKGAGQGLSGSLHVNENNTKDSAAMIAFALKGNLTALKEYKYDVVDKETGKPLGKMPITDHPAKLIKEQWSGLVELLQSVAHPPKETLPLPSIGSAGSVEEISDMVGSFNPSERVETVAAEHRMGFFMKLGQIDDVSELLEGYKWSFLTKQSAWVKESYNKFSKLSSAVRAYVGAVQASGWINHVFSQGKSTVSASGNSGSFSGGVQTLAEKIYKDAYEIPEGTVLYRGMSDTTAGKSMTQQFLSAKPGLIVQNTDSMCSSYNENHSWGGDVQLKIRCSKGAKGIPSFASGHFGSEHEITTLPGQRFVVLSVEKKNSGKGVLVDVLMLPPHEGYVVELGKLAALGKALVYVFRKVGAWASKT